MSEGRRITVLAGGVGAAKFLQRRLPRGVVARSEEEVALGQHHAPAIVLHPIDR